jgi:hypothetical protein
MLGYLVPDMRTLRFYVPLAVGVDENVPTTALMDFSLSNVISDRPLPDHAATEA